MSATSLIHFSWTGQHKGTYCSESQFSWCKGHVAIKEPSQDEFVDVNGNTWWVAVPRFTSTLMSKSVFNKCALPQSHSIHGLTLTHILIHWYFQRTALCQKEDSCIPWGHWPVSPTGKVPLLPFGAGGLFPLSDGAERGIPTAYLFFIHSSEVFRDYVLCWIWAHARFQSMQVLIHEAPGSDWGIGPQTVRLCSFVHQSSSRLSGSQG